MSSKYDQDSVDMVWEFAAINEPLQSLVEPSKAGCMIDLGFAVVTLLTLYLLLNFVFYLDGEVESHPQDRNAHLKQGDHHLLPLWHGTC